jgi:uncharacterized protein YfaS (alpha-2-macroglobulin family)
MRPNPGAGGGQPPPPAPKARPAEPAFFQPPARLREYFPETLLWRPALITDESGRATLEVPFADSITTWRLTGSASSRGGLLGGVSAPLRVFQDFFVDLDLPVALTQNDEVAFPVIVYNYLKTPQKVILKLNREPWFELIDGDFERTVEVKAGDVMAVPFRIRAKRPGVLPLQVDARGRQLSDAVRRLIEVLPDGSPVEQVHSGRLAGTARHRVHLPRYAMEGTEQLFVKVYPGVVSQVMEGLEGMLRMPTGCFEQTSSSAYPNALVLACIKGTRTASPAVLLKAEAYLSDGYQRLLTFERPGGGFDLWGNSEPVLWLSAYGLQEFNDMGKVHPIDQGVIDRTQAWLFKQQAADGTWSKMGASHPTFERMGNVRLLLTSYVTWAILDSMPRPAGWQITAKYERLKKAIEYIRAQAPRAKNAYILALAANTLASWDPSDEETSAVLKGVLKKLDRMQQADREGKVICYPADGQSLSYGREDSLTVETTALVALAMLKNGQFTDSVSKALLYLVKTRGPSGHWESTQATILALKALVAGMGDSEHKGATPFLVKVNGKQVAEGTVNKANADELQQFDLKEHLRHGDNEVSIEVKGKAGLMYQVVGRHFEAGKKEWVPEKPSLALFLEYDRRRLTTRDRLRVTATLMYSGGTATQNVIVDLPIPPGFTADGDEFAQMVRAKKVAKYTLTARRVTLYLGDVKPGDWPRFTYSLRPRYPVKVQARAAVAYEYYTPSSRTTTRPVLLTVEK